MVVVVAVAQRRFTLHAVRSPVEDRPRQLTSAGGAAPAGVAPSAASAAVAPAADPSGAVAPTHVQPRSPTRTPGVLLVGVAYVFGSPPPRPTVRVGPEQQGEDHRAKDDHNNDDGKEDGSSG